MDKTFPTLKQLMKAIAEKRFSGPKLEEIEKGEDYTWHIPIEVRYNSDKVPVVAYALSPFGFIAICKDISLKMRGVYGSIQEKYALRGFIRCDSIDVDEALNLIQNEQGFSEKRIDKKALKESTKYKKKEYTPLGNIVYEEKSWGNYHYKKKLTIYQFVNGKYFGLSQYDRYHPHRVGLEEIYSVLFNLPEGSNIIKDEVPEEIKRDIQKEKALQSI